MGVRINQALKEKMSRKYVLKLFIDTKTKGPFTRVCLNDRIFEKSYAALVRFSLVKYSVNSVIDSTQIDNVCKYSWVKKIYESL